MKLLEFCFKQKELNFFIDSNFFYLDDPSNIY